MRLNLTANFYFKSAVLVSWMLFMAVWLFVPVVGDAGAGLRGFTWDDKWIHLFFFAVLTWLLVWIGQELRQYGLDARLTVSFLISLILDATVEIVQIFIPSRDSSLFDFIFGLLGAMLALVVWQLWFGSAAVGKVERKN